MLYCILSSLTWVNHAHVLFQETMAGFGQAPCLIIQKKKKKQWRVLGNTFFKKKKKKKKKTSLVLFCKANKEKNQLSFVKNRVGFTMAIAHY